MSCKGTNKSIQILLFLLNFTYFFFRLYTFRFGTDIMSLDRLEVPSSAFDQPTENMDDALPLLYQSGYLTIKDYDRDIESYTLSIPNEEVRIGCMLLKKDSVR